MRLTRITSSSTSRPIRRAGPATARADSVIRTASTIRRLRRYPRFSPSRDSTVKKRVGDRNRRDCGVSVADDLHQRAFPAASVEFTVEDLFPRAEVQLALCDRDDHFPAHYLTLHMSVRVVLARPVVLVLGCRLVRRELLQPPIIVLVQAALVIVNEHRRRDVHGVDQHQTFLYAALGKALLDLARDIDERASGGNLKP